MGTKSPRATAPKPITGRRIQARLYTAHRFLVFFILCCFLWGGGLGLPGLRAASEPEQGSEQEKALRARAEEFYSFLQVGRWTEAEKYFTEDSKEAFRSQAKQPFLSYQIESVKLEPDGENATVVARLRMIVIPSPAPVTLSRSSHWRLVDNVWYVVIPKPESRTARWPLANAKDKSASPPPEELKFKGRLYHLGTMVVGQVKTARFPFTNVSDHRVTITDVETGCACLRVKLEKKEYKPGESGELVVEFDSTGYKYAYGQTIVLKTDPGDLTTYLTVDAMVNPPPPESQGPQEERK